MAYKIPTFNLNVSVYNSDGTKPTNWRYDTVGNLAYGQRGLMQFWDWGQQTGYPAIFSWLLLPAGTDIRDQMNEEGADAVEVPSFTGRFYMVQMVDDIGLGFDNEHRFAVIAKVGTWPTPIPSLATMLRQAADRVPQVRT